MPAQVLAQITPNVTPPQYSLAGLSPLIMSWRSGRSVSSCSALS